MDLKMTSRQQEIFQFIKGYASKYGYPPTVREIGKAVGLASSSTVHAHLANLEKYGVLRRDPDQAEGHRTAVRQGQEGGRSRRWRPAVVGGAAGAPVLAEENIEDYVQVPAVAGGDEGEYVCRCPARACATPASGRGTWSSAVRTARSDGEIVVALLGDEATVKRFFRERDHVRLQPENPRWNRSEP